MKMKHAMTGLLTAVGLTVALGTGASAASLTAIADSAGNSSAYNNATYTSGPAGTGGLTITNTGATPGTTDAFLHSKVGLGTDTSVSISFGPLTNAAGYTYNSGSMKFDQPLNGSTFIIQDVGTSTVLLSGNFGSADLTGTAGSGGAGVGLQANSVTYTGGTFFPAGFSNTNGSLSIEFTGIGGSGPVANSLGLQSFTANDGITYSASAPAVVPEPGTVISFLLGGLGVLGLMLRARRFASPMV